VAGPDPGAPGQSAGVAARSHALGVEYRLATGTVEALRGVEASFERARLSVITGPSGSGKSSLLRALAGLQRPCSGQVEIDGCDITRLRARQRRWLRRRSLGVVLQDPADNLVAYLRAREQVELAARLRGADVAEAPVLLDAVGLAGREHCFPAELSGGEQQRVAFAAGAIGRPTLLLADEPTAELDADAGARLVVIMGELVGRGATLVVASHDAAVVSAADHVVHLRDGRVVS
jgi:putative ABC transport system ATP-binding protein